MELFKKMYCALWMCNNRRTIKRKIERYMLQARQELNTIDKASKAN